MPDTSELGPDFETFVRQQVESGRYADANAVIQDALRLLHERAEDRAVIDEAITAGLADVAAGRVYDIDEVFDELEAEIDALPDRHVA